MPNNLQPALQLESLTRTPSDYKSFSAIITISPPSRRSFSNLMDGDGRHRSRANHLAIAGVLPSHPPILLLLTADRTPQEDTRDHLKRGPNWMLQTDPDSLYSEPVTFRGIIHRTRLFACFAIAIRSENNPRNLFVSPPFIPRDKPYKHSNLGSAAAAAAAESSSPLPFSDFGPKTRPCVIN